MYKKNCEILLALIGCFTTIPSFAFIDYYKNKYQPYLQFDGTKFLHTQTSSAAGSAKLFIPVWQRNLNDIIFTDLRFYDRSGSSFESNLYLGYRHLLANNQQILGFYGAFDRRKTAFSNYINQVSLGGEYWINQWFVGINYYRPIGKTTKDIDCVIKNYTIDSTSIKRTINHRFEKALTGVDAEIGYEFKEDLIGYIGGYYFSADDTKTICGPSARLTYSLPKNNGRILNIFDKIELEAGIKYDKSRQVTGYISANARIGWLFDNKAQLQGASRHMIDPIRRNIDIVSASITKTEQIKETNQESRLTPLTKRHIAINPIHRDADITSEPITKTEQIKDTNQESKLDLNKPSPASLPNTKTEDGPQKQTIIPLQENKIINDTLQDNPVVNKKLAIDQEIDTVLRAPYLSDIIPDIEYNIDQKHYDALDEEREKREKHND